jgi:hypothetical protein
VIIYTHQHSTNTTNQIDIAASAAEAEDNMLNNAIKAIEAKGYIVKASENRWMGKLDESCPTVYEILKPDYSAVYGANGIAPENLDKWLKLPELVKAERAETETVTAYDATAEAERKAKESEWDNIYNEGGEGYNPYRDSKPAISEITFWMASDNTYGQHYTVTTDLTDIIDIAYKYGRAEQGEIIEYNGQRAGWDSQYRKYRRQLDDGRWV